MFNIISTLFWPEYKAPFYRFIPNPEDRENNVYPGSDFFFILDHGGSGSQGQTVDPGSELLAKNM
jgi:hypothetical protein